MEGDSRWKRFVVHKDSAKRIRDFPEIGRLVSFCAEDNDSVMMGELRSHRAVVANACCNLREPEVTKIP